MLYKVFNSLFFLIITHCCLFVSSYATTTLIGDAAAPAGQTFSFPIQATISSPDGGAFYTAAHPSLGLPAEYAIARVYLDGSRFAPLTPQYVSLNGIDGQTDPLYNQNIAYLGLLSAFEGRGLTQSRLEFPIAVLSSDLKSVYVVDTFYGANKNGGAVESALNITDAAGAVTAGIVGLGNMSNVYAVAATQASSGGTFGQPGSGLAFIALESKTTTTDKTGPTNRVFSQQGNLPLDINSNKLYIQDPLASITNDVAFYWDENLGILYVGLQITAGAAAGDGGMAVAVFGEATQLNFNRPTIAPATVFTSGQQNEIIGAINPSAQVSINEIKTMLTSTNCNYLIVQGNNGAPGAATQSVFALPLVNSPTNALTHGTIADKTQTPDPKTGGFTQPATTPAQMTINTDVAAIVGGDNAPGAVSDMFVRGDSVFVSVFDTSAGLQGLYYSQALFDAAGAIMGWTDWARATGSIDQTTNTTDRVYAATFDPHGDYTMVTGTSVDALATVKRTVWGTDDGDGLLGGVVGSPADGLIQMTSALFANTNAGVQGIGDFPPATPGLQNISLFALTGLNQVSLVETGSVNGGVLTFNFGDFLTGSLQFPNGSLTQNPTAPTKVITIAGGALNTIGPVICAEVAADTLSDNAWIAVGGVGGLAILTQPNGDGWTASSGLGPNFAGLVNGMSFVKIGGYSFVRKLVCSDNFLYVLSDKQLDVIDLNVSNFGNGTLVGFSLATLPALGLSTKDTFIDLIVSEKFALLATSKGLYRVGNNKDIRQAQSPYDPAWTIVPLPQSVGPATQLWPITTSGRPQDFAIDGGSNLYVLNAYVGTNAAQLARYTISDVTDVTITDTTIEQVLNSYPTFSTPIQAPLVFYPGFRDLFATNGASFFNARSKNVSVPPFVNIVVGMRRGSTQNNQNPYSIPLTITTESHLTGIIRNSAMGNWLVAGDFGLRVNE